MFTRDRIINNPTPYEKWVNITEHRAPTDDSMKILLEMEDKIKDRLFKTVVVEGNTFNAKVFYFMHSFCVDKLSFTAIFTFNGKEHTVTGEVLQKDVSDAYEWGNHAVYVAVGRRLCELITDAMLKEVPDTNGMYPFNVRGARSAK